jgi:hypothetical protein
VIEVVMLGDVVELRWSYGRAPLSRHHTRSHVLPSFTNIVFRTSSITKITASQPLDTPP